MAERLMNNLKEDYLSCSICLQQYRYPKTLQCNHVFCKECLLNYLPSNIARHKDQSFMTCPLCREKMSITKQKSKTRSDINSWVESLPTDGLISSLIETVQRHETKTKRVPQSLPKLCETHGGKPKDAYCFTHARLICWECAARDHRACNVDSVDKARHMLQPEVESLKKIVGKKLSTARELSKIDQDFNNYKQTTTKEIQDFESRLDDMYASAKRQMKHLNDEVNLLTKKHLDERKVFYEVVSSLLELNNTLESMTDSSNSIEMIQELENVKCDVTRYVKEMETIATKNEANGETYMKFIVDDKVHTFLSMFSSIGFVDSNLDDVGKLSDRKQSTAPMSLAHILRPLDF